MEEDILNYLNLWRSHSKLSCFVGHPVVLRQHEALDF